MTCSTYIIALHFPIASYFTDPFSSNLPGQFIFNGSPVVEVSIFAAVFTLWLHMVNVYMGLIPHKDLISPCPGCIEGVEDPTSAFIPAHVSVTADVHQEFSTPGLRPQNFIDMGMSPEKADDPLVLPENLGKFLIFLDMKIAQGTVLCVPFQTF